MGARVGAYTFSWTNGDTTAVADSLYKGFYDVDMTDSNGCKLQRSYIVDEPDKLIVLFFSRMSSVTVFTGPFCLAK